MTEDRNQGRDDRTVEVLVLSGSMGSGKTSVLIEASDLLTAAQVPHAAVDFDMLALGYWRDLAADDLAYRNLSAIWRHYSAAGIARLVISEVIETANARERLREAVSASALVVCRLRAPLETMLERVRLREIGMLQTQLLPRVAELEAALDAAATEDFTVVNDGRSITEVAREVLERAGWITIGR